jgi:hypothetical protein
VLLAGLLGGAVAFLWLFTTNAVLPYKSSLIHKIAPNQLVLHQALKENITEPGTYSCPYLSRAEEDQLPDYRNQPVYTIIYQGYTHGGTGAAPMIFPLFIPFAVAVAAAWMLSVTTESFRSKFYRRFLFVALIGIIVSLYSDVLQMSFGPQPRDYLAFLAVNDLITWSLAGLVIAWRVRD